ncbi:MAG: hypothetical protein RMK18_11770 [Armatimonadota bacterium]|nr:hypothetical protein [Armatimonadota bacterium]MCX7778455.1 hypothetical protein [Armatimonadota bacterium]MDW8026524.1 hypothetical protein [Armatimonadota bacterium]
MEYGLDETQLWWNETEMQRFGLSPTVAQTTVVCKWRCCVQYQNHDVAFRLIPYGLSNIHHPYGATPPNYWMTERQSTAELERRAIVRE